MNHEELFVGAVAVLLGIAGVVAAIGNWETSYRLDKVRWLETVVGRRGARIVYAVLGVVLILLGLAIALDFGPLKPTAHAPEHGGRWLLSHKKGPVVQVT